VRFGETVSSGGTKQAFNDWMRFLGTERASLMRLVSIASDAKLVLLLSALLRSSGSSD
jgi:hypothetical protein